MDDWRNGDIDRLWNEAVAEHQRREEAGRSHSAPLSKEKQAQRNGKRVEQLVRLGEFRKAMTALESSGVADLSQQSAMDELRNKHPDEPAPHSIDQRTAPARFKADELLKVRSRMSRTASGGIDQFSCQDFLDCAFFTDSTRFLDEWLSCVDLLESGKVSGSVLTFLCGARLTALLKKDWGLRPVASGSLLRRTWGCMLALHQSKAIKLLVGPRQFGVECADGTLAAATAFEKMAFSALNHPDKVSLQVDFENAFNMISRAVLKRIVKMKCPELVRYFNACYSEHTALVCANGAIVWSRSGVQQGDPMGSYLFALFLADILGTVKVDDIGLDFHAAYHDDVMVVGFADRVALFLQRMNGVQRTHRSKLKEGKSHWYGTTAPPEEVAHLVEHHHELEAVVLGVPIGSASFVNGTIEKVVDKWEASALAIRHVPDVLCRLELLLRCLSVCRVTHLLRARFQTGADASWQVRFDNRLRTELTRIVGSQLSEKNWRLAQLSVGNGGPGLHTIKLTKSAAFISSHHSTCTRLVELFLTTKGYWTRRVELDMAQDYLAQQTERQFAPETTQRVLMRAVMTAERQRYEAGCTQVQRDLMWSRTQKGASAWLSGQPDAQYRFTNAEARVLLKYRLMMSITKSTKCGRSTSAAKRWTFSVIIRENAHTDRRALSGTTGRLMSGPVCSSALVPRCRRSKEPVRGASTSLETSLRRN